MATKADSRIQQVFGVGDKKSLIELFLQRLDGRTVPEQLISKGCKVIAIGPFAAGATSERYPDKTVVYLNAQRSFEYWLEAVPHELAHMFFFPEWSWEQPSSLSYEQWIMQWDQACRDALLRYNPFPKPELEAFCDVFAGRWLEVGSNRQGLTEILRVVHTMGEWQAVPPGP